VRWHFQSWRPCLAHSSSPRSFALRLRLRALSRVACPDYAGSRRVMNQHQADYTCRQCRRRPRCRPHRSHPRCRNLKHQCSSNMNHRTGDRSCRRKQDRTWAGSRCKCVQCAQK
jgi:hypothetical protein